MRTWYKSVMLTVDAIQKSLCEFITQHYPEYKVQLNVCSAGPELNNAKIISMLVTDDFKETVEFGITIKKYEPLSPSK